MQWRLIDELIAKQGPGNFGLLFAMQALIV
jgi:hypothetical protein